MNISFKSRVAALIVSVAVTIILFDAIASLASPTTESALQLASAAAVR